MALIPPLLIYVFAVLHILCAVGWLGLNLTFELGVGKAESQLSEATRKEYNAKLGRKFGLQYRVFSGLTIVFGVLFAYSFAGGDLSLYSLTNQLGSRIAIGALLGLFAYVIGNSDILRVSPVRKLARYFRKLGLGSLELYVLMAAFLFMVAGAHPYV